MPTHSWKILLTIAFGLSSTSALASSACDSVKFSIHLDVKDLTECIGDLQLENQTNEMAIDALEPIPVMWKRILRVGNNWCILVR